MGKKEGLNLEVALFFLGIVSLAGGVTWLFFYLGNKP